MHLLIRTVQTYSHFRRLSFFFIFILASLSHHHILINKNREVIIASKKIFFVHYLTRNYFNRGHKDVIFKSPVLCIAIRDCFYEWQIIKIRIHIYAKYI